MHGAIWALPALGKANRCCELAGAAATAQLKAHSRVLPSRAGSRSTGQCGRCWFRFNWPVPAAVLASPEALSSDTPARDSFARKGVLGRPDPAVERSCRSWAYQASSPSLSKRRRGCPPAAPVGSGKAEFNHAPRSGGSGPIPTCDHLVPTSQGLYRRDIRAELFPRPIGSASPRSAEL